MIVRGHPLVLRQYYEVTHCNHCQTIIWGVSPQGYHCTGNSERNGTPCTTYTSRPTIIVNYRSRFVLQIVN